MFIRAVGEGLGKQLLSTRMQSLEGSYATLPAPFKWNYIKSELTIKNADSNMTHTRINISEFSKHLIGPEG